MEDGWGFVLFPLIAVAPGPFVLRRLDPPPPLLGFDLLVRVQLLRFLHLPAWREGVPDPRPRSGRQMGQEAGSFFQAAPLFILDRLQQ